MTNNRFGLTGFAAVMTLTVILLCILALSLALRAEAAGPDGPPPALDPRCAARPITPYGPPGGRTYLDYSAYYQGRTICQVSWEDVTGRAYTVTPGSPAPEGYDYAILPRGLSMWVDEGEGDPTRAIQSAWVYTKPNLTRAYLPAVAFTRACPAGWVHVGQGCVSAVRP